MYPYFKSVFILFLLLTISNVQITGQLTADQYILSTSGGQGIFSNNQSMSWTIGEMIIETGIQADHKFTQGFIQPGVVEVIINEEVTIFIPSGLSPNGDGINDIWDIQGIDLFDDFQVKILNRWGNVLYSTTHTNYSPWDGTYKGSKVPTSDYYYVLESLTLNKVYTGTLTVKY